MEKNNAVKIAEIAKNLDQYDGQTVVLKGWVYNKRSSGKIKFLMLRDGSGIVQSVLVKGEVDDASFDSFEGLTQESSVIVTGKVRKEARSKLGFEMTTLKVETLQIANNYPISLKEHGVEFLMENRHLWIRSQRQWAALRVRSEIFFAIQEFFRKRGFIRFDPPILTPTSCEGTSTLFKTPYFDEEAFLTQSGQLYGEAGAFAFGNIYTFGPTFRAEKSKTRKHLTEFWMVEPEMAYGKLTDVMDLGEAFVGHIIKHCLENCQAELTILERDQKELENIISGAFPRISYDEALKILEKRGHAIPWGEDFGAPHETALGEEFGKPVFIHHFPSSIKAFYFKHADDANGDGVDHDGKYALGADLIAPFGYGEIIGGGQREDNMAVLERRIQEHGLAQKDYEWYLDLRRYGSVPHAGFGLGVERTVAWVTGVEHVRETIPFPRMLNHLKP
jgi:asparaginyl-tRNA synthetase